MSDLLKIRVVARDGVRLTLRVRLLPAEQGRFCTARGFAWMMMNPSENKYAFKMLAGAALRECGDTVNAIDEANLESPDRKPLAHALVLSVAVTDLRNYTEERRHDLWGAAPDAQAAELLYPEAMYRIELADARLAAHLAEGFEWSSTAYNELGTDEFVPYK